MILAEYLPFLCIYMHIHTSTCVCVSVRIEILWEGGNRRVFSHPVQPPHSHGNSLTLQVTRSPLPRHVLRKKKKKKDEKRREREENPHQRCTPTGAGPAEHQVAGPSSISDMTWMKVHKVCDTGGGISAHVFVAALLQHHLPPCARCSATAIAGYIGYIYRERIHPYERTTLQRQEPIGGGYLLPARP